MATATPGEHSRTIQPASGMPFAVPVDCRRSNAKSTIVHSSRRAPVDLYNLMLRVQQRKRNLQRHNTIDITTAERPQGTPRQARETGDLTAKKICTTVSCAIHKRGYKASTKLNLARNRLCSELQQAQSKQDRALEDQAEKLRLQATEQEAARKLEEQREDVLMEELFEGDFSWDQEWENMNDN